MAGKLGRGVVQQDVFMQFLPFAIKIDASNSTTLVEEEITTGLSIRGNFAMSFHMIEIQSSYFSYLDTTQEVRVCLSTRQGETAVPNFDDVGLVARFAIYGIAAAPGPIIGPIRQSYVPPVVLASPKFSVYANTSINDADAVGKYIRGRIGYTTVPIDQKLYLEIAETWESL